MNNAGFVGTVFGKINTHDFSFNVQAPVKKFDYIKLYHEEAGFVLAQVMELTNEENKITANCEIIGYRDSRDVLKIPNSTIASNSEVYIADSNFIKLVLGLDKSDGVYLGLLDNYNMIQVKLDVKNLVTKHLAVLAKTGAGKSYTLGVIVEELIDQGVPCVIIDPHGEYSSLKYKNSSKNDLELMHRYDVSPKGYESSVDEYSPNPDINIGSKPFSISINSLSAHEIATLTPIKVNGTQLGLLFNAITYVKRENPKYSITDVRNHLDTINSNIKYGLYACLEFIENVGVFSDNPIDVRRLVNPGRVTLINLRGVPPDIQQIIVAKVCNDLFEKRKTNEVLPFFLIVEEAHNFCPERSFGETPSSYILRNIASEGRKFGLGLGVVSQRPARVDKNVLSQCNTQIIQKVTNPNDLKAISNSAENIAEGMVDDIATLPVGTALVVGASAKPVFVDVRVRKSEHGGKSVSLTKPEPVVKKVEAKVTAPKPIEIKLAAAPIAEPLKTIPKPAVIDSVNISVLNLPKSLDKNGLNPFYLAKVSDGVKTFNVLVNESLQIVSLKNGVLAKAELSNESSIKSLGAKAEALFNILKEKGSATISYLFNSLNFPFQDIDFVLKNLEKANLVSITGSKIFLKNPSLSLLGWSKELEHVSSAKESIPVFKTNSEDVKKSLEAANLKVYSIDSVYVKS